VFALEKPIVSKVKPVAQELKVETFVEQNTQVSVWVQDILVFKTNRLKNY
jgi:hypothetical protein